MHEEGVNTLLARDDIGPVGCWTLIILGCSPQTYGAISAGREAQLQLPENNRRFNKCSTTVSFLLLTLHI